MATYTSQLINPSSKSFSASDTYVDCTIANIGSASGTLRMSGGTMSSCNMSSLAIIASNSASISGCIGYCSSYTDDGSCKVSGTKLAIQGAIQLANPVSSRKVQSVFYADGSPRSIPIALPAEPFVYSDGTMNSMTFTSATKLFNGAYKFVFKFRMGEVPIQTMTFSGLPVGQWPSITLYNASSNMAILTGGTSSTGKIVITLPVGPNYQLTWVVAEVTTPVASPVSFTFGTV